MAKPAKGVAVADPIKSATQYAFEVPPMTTRQVRGVSVMLGKLDGERVQDSSLSLHRMSLVDHQIVGGKRYFYVTIPVEIDTPETHQAIREIFLSELTEPA